MISISQYTLNFAAYVILAATIASNIGTLSETMREQTMLQPFFCPAALHGAYFIF